MRKSQLVKHLSSLNEDELREEILRLYDRLDKVRQYYTMELGSEADRKKKYDAVKKEIIAKFATKSRRRPRRPRIQKIQRILSAAAKMSVFDFEMIDIYLFTVEEGLKFMRVYNFESTPLYNLIVKSFEKASQLIDLNHMHDQYRERCSQILGNARISKDIHKQINSNFDKIYG